MGNITCKDCKFGDKTQERTEETYCIRLESCHSDNWYCGDAKMKITGSERETKKFIKRERVRRELMKTKAGETICLHDWQIDILLEWIRELEREVKAWKK